MFFMSINRERRVMVNVILLMCAWSLSVTLIVPLMVGNGGAVRNGADGDAASWIQHLCPNYRTKPGSRDTLSWRPPSAQDIFFTQTSCAAALSMREACAVESAARHHPHQQVLVLMTAPDLDLSHPLLQLLQTLSNVQLAWLDLDRVFVEGGLREWHRGRQWMFSEGRTSAEVSDAVRAELLRRYGGTYVDLDAITLRPLPTTMNWLGRIDSKLVTAAVSRFAPGHPLLQSVVDNIPSSFDPHGCCSIGPNLFTHLLHQSCPKNVTTPSSAHPDEAEHCNGVTIFPKSYFYPVHYGYRKDQLESIFREGEGLGRAFLSSTQAFSLHLFNSLSHQGQVSPDGDSVLSEVARRNCPALFHLVKTKDRWL
ncbi:lactosylceramide 4-alpha-galactosyltransferase-like [Penaeus vannamei]|uniref:lactosylceramide 4-alpha-galactosyltransferase-like n=1 Tax=Penaeus vannamei TaxID=6689 RepID=UPI00387F887A